MEPSSSGRVLQVLKHFLAASSPFKIGNMVYLMQNKSIVNLSINLNRDHISVLNRGLKFCPSPTSPNVGELREDLDRFHKRLRQIAFFENPEDILEDLQFCHREPAPHWMISIWRVLNLSNIGNSKINPIGTPQALTIWRP